MQSFDQQIIFVVGHERSGTSLVRAIFDAHGEFSIPPTDADILLMLEKESSGNFFPRRKFEKLISYEKLVPWNIDWPTLEDSFHGEFIDYRELFKRILESFWHNNPGKKKAIKRPKYEHRIAQLLQIFPESRIIALIRDPRAVLASKKYYGGSIGKNWNRGNIFYIHLITSIIRWKLSVQKIREAEKIYGTNRIAVMKYEEIVCQPDLALKKIFAFTKDDYNESEIFLAIKNGFNSNSTFIAESKNKEIFRKDAIDRWKDKLNPVEIMIIEKILGKIMREEGMTFSRPCLSSLQRIVSSINYLLFKLIYLARRSQNVN